MRLCLCLLRGPELASAHLSIILRALELYWVAPRPNVPFGTGGLPGLARSPFSRTWLRLAIPDARQAVALLPAQTHKRKLLHTDAGVSFWLVAGAGIAPTARGYEPREILLLHPAVRHYTIQHRETATTKYVRVRAKPFRIN